MKILTIIGARPQLIKAATLSNYIKKSNNNVEEIIIHTGQHYDKNMSEIFFKEMNIPIPDYNLGIGGMSHGKMTGRMIEKIEEISLIQNPDWILVYGDTNSTLAGAIVASKLNIKLAHVEAGLRSYNNNMPEEINRILTDRVSDILFCPTATSVDNLTKEGFDNFNNKKIVNVGDIMYEGAINFSKKSKKPKEINENEIFILCTIHRAETTDNIDNLKNIIEALNYINKKIKIILPIHPRTKKILDLNNIKCEFKIIEPVGYLEMIWLIQNCVKVITDSGGLQKEAYFFEKHCITMRTETEWIELIKSGNNILVGYDKSLIIEYALKNQTFENTLQLYGNGNTSHLIINQLINY